LNGFDLITFRCQIPTIVEPTIVEPTIVEPTIVEGPKVAVFIYMQPQGRYKP
jgi:hypothetical protein